MPSRPPPPKVFSQIFCWYLLNHLLSGIGEKAAHRRFPFFFVKITAHLCINPTLSNFAHCFRNRHPSLIVPPPRVSAPPVLGVICLYLPQPTAYTPCQHPAKVIGPITHSMLVSVGQSSGPPPGSWPHERSWSSITFSGHLVECRPRHAILANFIEWGLGGVCGPGLSAVEIGFRNGM